MTYIGPYSIVGHCLHVAEAVYNVRDVACDSSGVMAPSRVAFCNKGDPGAQKSPFLSWFSLSSQWVARLISTSQQTLNLGHLNSCYPLHNGPLTTLVLRKYSRRAVEFPRFHLFHRRLLHNPIPSSVGQGFDLQLACVIHHLFDWLV